MNKSKKIFAAFVIAVMALSGAAAVTAASPSPSPTATATARPRPDSGSSQTSGSTKSDNSQDSSKNESSNSKSSGTEAEKTPAVNVTPPPAVETASPQTVSNKKYTTRGGAFGWFLLSVIVNAALSFAIGNRFYKMSKKDTRSVSEIRALRRDVEEKFEASVGNIAEQDIDITNSNPDYSSDADGIKAHTQTPEESETAEEIFKKWEKQLSAQRAERRAAIRESVKPKSTEEVVNEEDEHQEHDVKAYKPRRDMSFEEEDTEDFDEGDYEDENGGKLDSIKSKAKELITDIFPFKDE